MKKLCFFLPFILLLAAGCSNSPEKIHTVDEIAKRTELKPELISASLNYGGNLIKSERLDKMLPYKNGFLFFSYSEKAGFICDNTLNVKKKIELSAKYLKQLSERIFDLFINGDTLFICDMSMSIKKVNLANEELSVIPLKGLIYFSQPYYLSFTGEGEYVYTFNPLINTTKDKIPSGDIVVGAVFSPQGNMIKQIAVNKDFLSHAAWGKDMALYSESGDKRYIYFRLDKNILPINDDLSGAGKKFFYVNKEWRAPHIVNNKFAAYIVNNQLLERHNGAFVHLPPLGKSEGNISLVIYDPEINPLQRIILAGTENLSDISYSVCGDKIVLFALNGRGNKNIYIFDIAKL